jgi:hypothetical protein
MLSMKIVDWVTFRNIYREESFAKFRQTDRQTDRESDNNDDSDNDDSDNDDWDNDDWDNIVSIENASMQSDGSESI